MSDEILVMEAPSRYVCGHCGSCIPDELHQPACIVLGGITSETPTSEDYARAMLERLVGRVDEETPKRLVRALYDLTTGYHDGSPERILKTFDAPLTDPGIVVVKDMPFASLCEHHCLPFSGTASLAYLPTDRIVGLSKIPRLLRHFTRRLQVQERIGQQVCDAIMEHLKPRGVMTVIRAQHSCMALRGVECNGSMVTSTVRGVFAENPAARAEALELMR